LQIAKLKYIHYNTWTLS